MKPRRDLPPPPGSPQAQRICSRSQNRAGDGGCGPGGVHFFFVLPWRPVHSDVDVGHRGVVTLRFGDPDGEPPGGVNAETLIAARNAASLCSLLPIVADLQ